MSVLDNEVKPNDYNFTEKKLLSAKMAVEMSVTNNTTRTMKFGETVFLNGYVGEVMEQDGIIATATGLININPDRHISMNQVDVADTFAAQKNPIYFLPQTNSDPGEWKDTDTTGLVVFKAEVIEAAPAATPAYIVFKPPYQNGDLALTT
jgi:hypothetical protein